MHMIPLESAPSPYPHFYVTDTSITTCPTAKQASINVPLASYSRLVLSENEKLRSTLSEIVDLLKPYSTPSRDIERARQIAMDAL